MCHFETDWSDSTLSFTELPFVLNKLSEMESDGLLHISDDKLVVTEEGKPFVRNICMAFDLRLIRKKTYNSIVFDDCLTAICFQKSLLYL